MCSGYINLGHTTFVPQTQHEARCLASNAEKSTESCPRQLRFDIRIEHQVDHRHFPTRLHPRHILHSLYERYWTLPNTTHQLLASNIWQLLDTPPSSPLFT